MPELIRPDVRVRRSFVQALEETVAEGSLAEAGNMGAVGSRYAVLGDSDETFAQYVAAVQADALPETPRHPRFVPQTTLWWVAGDQYLGRISVRHELNDFLRELGGHIGYFVRPAQRRRGHATAMLQAVLPWAYEIGVDPALVTCDDTNVASRKVIEAAGGVFEDQRGAKLRYWVPTGHPKG